MQLMRRSLNDKQLELVRNPEGWLIGTALHEAGHAVIAHHYNFVVKHVSIVPEEEREGLCLFSLRLKEGDRRKLFQDGVVSYAGRAAAERYTMLIHGIDSDLAHAEMLAKQLYPVNERAQRASRERMFKRAGQLCRKYSGLIEHIACALLQRSELNRVAFIEEIARFANSVGVENDLQANHWMSDPRQRGGGQEKLPLGRAAA